MGDQGDRYADLTESVGNPGAVCAAHQRDRGPDEELGPGEQTAVAATDWNSQARSESELGQQDP